MVALKIFKEARKIFSGRLKKSINESKERGSKPKSYDEIPGPVRLPFIGTAWTFFIPFGKYDYLKMCDLGFRMLRDYGPLVREEYNSLKILHVFNPSAMEILFKAYMKTFPSRPQFGSINYYRTNKPEMYNNPGLTATNGLEWWKIRRIVQIPMSPLKEVRQIVHDVDEITNEFIKKAFKVGVIEDLIPLLHRLGFEIIWYDLFGERLRSLDPENLAPDSLPSIVIEAVVKSNDFVERSDDSNFDRKYFKPKPYKIIVKNMELLEKILLKQFEKVRLRADHTADNCLTARYMKRPDMDDKDTLGIIIELLLGGFDAVSFQLGFLMNHLGKYPNVQKKLIDECKSLLPNPLDPITSDVLKQVHYTRAVIKESFRLTPPNFGNTFTLPEDTVVSGYLIPMGTLILTHHMVACRQESNFPDSSKFIPERWIKSSENHRKVSPYLVLPFGFGIRTCVARRRSEQMMLILLLRVFRELKVEALNEVNLVSGLSNKPDKPVRLLFYK